MEEEELVTIRWSVMTAPHAVIPSGCWRARSRYGNAGAGSV